MRAFAALLGIALLLAAIAYAAAVVGVGFMSYLAAANIEWLLLTGVLGIATIASLVLGLTLLFRPTRHKMLTGLALLVPVIFVIPMLGKI